MPRSPSAVRPLTDRAAEPATVRERPRVDRSRPTIILARVAGSASAVSIDPTLSPSRNTVTRSETSSTSSSLWETKMMACPSAAMARIVTNRL